VNWLYGLWYARLRKIDLNVLWPACKQQARTIDDAKAAFAVHAYHDRAWLFLGVDEVFRRIDRLK